MSLSNVGAAVEGGAGVGVTFESGVDRGAIAEELGVLIARVCRLSDGSSPPQLDATKTDTAPTTNSAVDIVLVALI